MGTVDFWVTGTPLKQCEVGFRLGLGYTGLRQGLSSEKPCPPGAWDNSVFGTVGGVGFQVLSCSRSCRWPS